MDYFGEQPKFEIQPVIEQKPFESPAVQSFFQKWCEINDSIQPQIIGRDDWKKRGIKGVLEKRPDSKQTLFIPEDLQLWEMVEVMEVVDHDTFAAKPERQTEAKEKLVSLAKTFQNAGTYIAQRLEGIAEGREIAEALALEFYEYGQSLVKGERSETAPDLNQVASQSLTLEDTERLDRFLAGDTLYEARQKRVERAIAKDSSKKDELYEAERQRTLSQFFRVAEKAFTLESKSTDGELQESATQLKPWQSDAPIHSAFLAKIEKAITQKIETPKREFEMAIFRRGLEKLVGEMKERGWKHGVNSLFEKLGINLRLEQRKIADALNISQLRTKLETVRQTRDASKISAKEREIADKIQKAVGSFPYQEDANNPADMVANQYINCVGASTLGGALMKEAGLNYLVGDVPEHSITVLVTADGKIFWYDMLGTLFNGKEIKDSDLRGTNGGGNQITVKDIVDFSRNPSTSPGGMRMEIPSLWYRLNMGKLGKFPNPYFTVFPPEYGQQEQILNNTGSALSDLGRHEEAVEAYRQAVAVDPKFAYPYYDLGNALSDLGRHEEAVEAYRKFIDLADKKKDDYWIKRAERIIAEL